MKNVSLQSLGGKARAKQQRESALATYYSSPNYCLFCNVLISVPENVKVNQVRVKKFCNRNCYFQFKIGKNTQRLQKLPVPKICQRCNNTIKPLRTNKKFCDSCRYISYKSLDRVTKGIVWKKSKLAIGAKFASTACL